jgi:hypothetical protein
MPSKPSHFLCKSHPDFHIPADAEVGAGFDGEAYCARLKASGVDSVAIFGKCSYGHAYYDSRFGTRHPRLRKDMVAEVCRGADKVGIGVVAYYSVFLDTAAVVAHPDWRMRATDTSADAGFDSGRFQAVCVNSPYLEELLIPQSVELARDYPIDELLWDTMTGFQPCYCTHCRTRFGRDIPRDATDPAWLDYVAFYARQYEQFYARSTAAVQAAARAAGKNIRLGYNWEYGYRRPAEVTDGINLLLADLTSNGTVASLTCRTYAGTGLAFEYMCGRFMHGLDEWNSNTPESLLHTGAVTLANGGSFYLIDRQLPDGSLEERAYQSMRDVFGYFQQRRPWLAGTTPVPEIAVLHSYRSLMGADLRYFPDGKARQDRLKPLEGVARLFMEHGRHYTVQTEPRLRRRLDDYRLVVLPELEFLEPQTVDALTTWVHNGGQLILTQAPDPANLDPALLDLAGVHVHELRKLPFGFAGISPPLLLRGRFARFDALPGTQTLVPYTPPVSYGDGGERFGHGFAPPDAPPYSPSRDPLVTLRALGTGRVAYLGLPFFRAYFDHQNPQQARLFLSILDRLLPDPVARTTTPAQHELTSMRRGDDLIVHVVSHACRERLGTYWYPVIEYLPEVRDIRLSLRDNGRIRQILSVPDGTPLPTTRNAGRVHVTLPPLTVMQSVCVEDYFAPH